MNNVFQSILILSTGRTGTKFLAKTLQILLPQAAVFHEGGEKSRLVNILSHAQLVGIIPEKLPFYAWKMAILPGLRQAQEKKSIYIDANNHLYVFAIMNKDLYPSLKIIHIVRDPRDYIRSHINWSRSRLKSFIANYLTPFWQPSGFLMGDMSLSNWRDLSRLEKYAWIWVFKNRYIQQLETVNTPYLRVRFEDLFHSNDPGSVLNTMLSFIDVKIEGDLNLYFNKTINASKVNIQSWPTWNAEICKKINIICGELMELYGYGSEPDWIQKCSIGGG